MTGGNGGIGLATAKELREEGLDELAGLSLGRAPMNRLGRVRISRAPCLFR